MAQRLFNLTKWRFMREGEAVTFSNPRQRTVILDVNAPSEVTFYVRQNWEQVVDNPEWVDDLQAGRSLGRENDPPGTLEADDGADQLLTFVGLVKGRDTLEFAVEGPFDLLVEGGPAYVYTFDGQDISTKIVAPEIYTRIANRRQRNPHLELMQYLQRVRQDEFEAGMMAEMERRVEAVKKGLESHVAQRDARTPSLKPPREIGEQGGSPAEREEPAPADDKSDKSAGGGGDSKRKRKVSAPADVPDEEDDT